MAERVPEGCVLGADAWGTKLCVESDAWFNENMQARARDVWRLAAGVHAIMRCVSDCAADGEADRHAGAAHRFRDD